MLKPQAYPEVVKTFLEIVPIHNPSQKEDELMLWLVDKLTGLGLDSISQDNFGNLIANVSSNKSANSNSIMFVAHLDSVYPCKDISVSIQPDQNDHHIKPGSRTILSADDKAGISAIIEAIRLIKDNNISHPDIELVFTVQEEIGLLGAKALEYNKFKSTMAYSVDGEAPVGTIITQGPSQKLFNLKFIGKSAHAGMSPEKGINAILIAAEFLNNITIGRIDHSTTSNIGLIEGGVANNVIPESVNLTGEVRSLYEAKLDGILGTYKVEAQKIIEKFPGANFVFSDEFRYHSFFVDTEHPSVKLAVKACENINLKPVITSIGSGSDANIFNFNEMPTLILGAGFKNSHSLEESISFSQLELLTNLIVNIIKEAAK